MLIVCSACLCKQWGVVTTRQHVSGAEVTPVTKSLLSLLSIWCRQMFVNHRLAKVAAENELQEAQARINVQQQLAAAQAQVGSSSSSGMRVEESDHWVRRFGMKLTLLVLEAAEAQLVELRYQFCWRIRFAR